MNTGSIALRSDPIFIVGYKRSGTTVLRLMLNRHSSIFIPEESGYFQRVPKIFRNDIEKPDEVDTVVARIPRGGYHETMDWGIFKDLIRSNLPVGPGDILASIYQAYATTHGKPGARWGDKKPQHWQFVYKLRTWYPHSQFVHIVRDPKDTVASIIQYTRKNDVKLTQHEFMYRIPGLPAHIVLAWHIAWAHRELVKQGRTLGASRYIKVRYEDLVGDSRSVLSELCTFLSIDPSDVDTLLDFQEDAKRADVMGNEDSRSSHMKETKNELNLSRIGRYKSILSAEQCQEIEYICRSLIKDMGYERSPSDLPFYKKVFCALSCGVLDCAWSIVRRVRRLQGSL